MYAGGGAFVRAAGSALGTVIVAGARYLAPYGFKLGKKKGVERIFGITG